MLDHLTRALAPRYRVDHEIGRGGMAHVFLAHDLKLDRPVALKVLRPDLAAAIGTERFLREIALVANLEHPHILSIHDSGEIDGVLYFVMPYVRGESLRALLDREKQLPIDDALLIARDLSEALSHAHSHGVIHRDLKPENILLHAGHAVVADFGIARAIDHAGGERLTETGLAIGTPAYMSPEQAAGSQELDGRSDLYALGCVLYEMLAGEPPFTGPTVESIVRQHLTAEAPDVAHIRGAVSPRIAAAVRRCLAKVPADRFPTAAQFVEALDGEGPPTVIPTHGAAWRRPRWVTFAAAGAAVLVLAAGGMMGVRAWRTGGALPPSGPPPFTILAEFEGSADAEIQEAVRRLVGTALDQSSILQTLPDGQVRAGLSAAGRPDTTRLTLATAQELAVRGRLRSVVAGSVDRVGESYAITLRVLDADSGTVLATERSTARRENDVIAKVDEITRAILAGLGERRGAVGRRQPLTWITTPSFAAFRKLGGRSNTDWAALRARYGQAIALDSDFAYVWGFLGNTYYNLGFRDSARWAWSEALRRPDRLSDEQRSYFESMVSFERGDYAASAEALGRQYRGVNPNDLGIMLSGLGRPDSSVVLMERWERRTPFGLVSVELGNLSHWLVLLGRYDEARARADQMGVAGARLLRLAAVETATGRWTSAESLAVLITSDPRERGSRWRSALGYAASSEAARGELRPALRSLDAAAQSAARDGQPDAVRSWLGAELTLRAASGTAGDRALPQSLHRDSTAAGQLLAALWVALAGDTSAARRYLTASAAAPEGERLDLGDQARVVQGVLLASAGDWRRVVALVTPVARRRTARGPDIDQIAAWITAEAYRRLGHLDSAATYFALVSSGWRARPGGSLLRGLTDSFARQRLVVLYARLGRLEDARQQWQILRESLTRPDPILANLLDEARAALEAAERQAG